jgi:hypothetical protein
MKKGDCPLFRRVNPFKKGTVPFSCVFGEAKALARLMERAMVRMTGAL